MASELESIVSATWSNRDWRVDAACASLGNEIFFPVGNLLEAVSQTRVAKTVCASCPVRESCLEFALRTAQEDGIWGGCTEDERRSIRRSRRAAARKRSQQAS